MTIITLLLSLSTLAAAAPARTATPLSRDPRPVTWVTDGDQNTPADSLYRSAQRLLNQQQYQRAVETFRTLRQRYPRSPRAGDAYYWEAFALQRLGGSANLKVARDRLTTQAHDWPRAATRGDAGGLLTRVQQDLAGYGDPQATAWLDSARITLEHDDSIVVVDNRGATTIVRGGHDGDNDNGDVPPGCDADKAGEQMMAVQALMTMDPARSVPILRRVMARRDPCAAPLRRRAVFILGQQSRDSDVTPMMLDVAKNDPDREVRKMALFSLGQSGSPAAVDALAEILRTSSDNELQKSAVFALSQSQDDRAGGILRDLITRPGVDDDVVRQAVLFLGQRRDGADAGFLRQVYPRMHSDDAKKMVLMTLAQTGDRDNARWLMDRVLDRNESMELRRSALFFVGTQSEAVDVQQIASLYSPTLELEMRKQILFVLSQRREPAAVDKLLDIAKNDPDRDMRKQAIFWLGQSGDPRAAELLEHMLDQ